MEICKEIIYLYKNALCFKNNMVQTGNTIAIKQYDILYRKYGSEYIMYFIISKWDGTIYYYSSYDKNVRRI